MVIPPPNKALPEAPIEYVIKCPATLPEPTITESQWRALPAKDQWEYVKFNIGAPWATEYFKCAERHNTFVDWYLKYGMDE